MPEVEVALGKKTLVQFEAQASLLGRESLEVKVELEKTPVQLGAQASLLGRESLEVKVELKKIPVELGAQASLVVRVCLGAEVDSQKTGAVHRRAEYVVWRGLVVPGGPTTHWKVVQAINC